MTAPGDRDPERQLERYVGELQRWGKRVNLVGSTRHDALSTHIDDALAASRALMQAARVVDLGTGAGLPGIPLAITRPDLDLVLVEIRERRVSFLRHVVRELDLGCEVRRVRIEDPPIDGFDVVLVRAVGPAREIIPRAAPWARPQGEIWLWTRLGPSDLGSPEMEQIPLGEGRGQILRIPAAEVSRGTLAPFLDL